MGHHSDMVACQGKALALRTARKANRVLSRSQHVQTMTNHDQRPTLLQHDALKPSDRVGSSNLSPWTRRGQAVKMEAAAVRTAPLITSQNVEEKFNQLLRSTNFGDSNRYPGTNNQLVARGLGRSSARVLHLSGRGRARTRRNVERCV